LEVAKTKRLKPLFPFSSNSSMAHSHIWKKIKHFITVHPVCFDIREDGKLWRRGWQSWTCFASWNQFLSSLITFQITGADQESNPGKWLPEESGSGTDTGCRRSHVWQGVRSGPQCHYWRRNRSVAQWNMFQLASKCDHWCPTCAEIRLGRSWQKQNKKQIPFPESASELYWPSDHRFSAK
jgi:hypothetical protein